MPHQGHPPPVFPALLRRRRGCSRGANAESILEHQTSVCSWGIFLKSAQGCSEYFTITSTNSPGSLHLHDTFAAKREKTTVCLLIFLGFPENADFPHGITSLVP